jgi:hypothetical protein
MDAPLPEGGGGNRGSDGTGEGDGFDCSKDQISFPAASIQSNSSGIATLPDSTRHGWLSDNFFAAAGIASGFSSAINMVPVTAKKSAIIPIESLVFIECFFSSQDEHRGFDRLMVECLLICFLRQ